MPSIDVVDLSRLEFALTASRSTSVLMACFGVPYIVRTIPHPHRPLGVLLMRSRVAETDKTPSPMYVGRQSRRTWQ